MISSKMKKYLIKNLLKEKKINWRVANDTLIVDKIIKDKGYELTLAIDRNGRVYFQETKIRREK